MRKEKKTAFHGTKKIIKTHEREGDRQFMQKIIGKKLAAKKRKPLCQKSDLDATFVRSPIPQKKKLLKKNETASEFQHGVEGSTNQVALVPSEFEDALEGVGPSSRNPTFFDAEDSDVSDDGVVPQRMFGNIKKAYQQLKTKNKKISCENEDLKQRYKDLEGWSSGNHRGNSYKHFPSVGRSAYGHIQVMACGQWRRRS
ncbi:uncharacterized protein LOC143138148 isoform X2 [Alosa pseudoharengus]|uniref:uncharacterized protein LOC143138148 isoform X2 n=1 Tax=Alosa pseudoharengus TaxID=34774 RepID=UPI003F8B0163